MMTWMIVPVGGQIVYCKGQRGVCVCPVCLALGASYPGWSRD